MKPQECILFSGGAQGAEAEFGAAAEKFGVEEVNFTFEGHRMERARGIRALNHEELKKGDVSLAYVSRIMNRKYPDAPLIRKVLQSIWYQVNSGQEVYVVGRIMDDGTVRGGTGWGAEFPLGEERGPGDRAQVLHRHRHTVARGQRQRGDHGPALALLWMTLAF
jgi:hypothetical protein